MAETANRTESLFAAAAALPPEERGAFLERECSGDSALLDELRALLKAHDRAGHLIDRPVNGDADQTAGYAPASEKPGTVVAGRYKLLEEIGQGGMGTVWAAEQTTPVRRKVALKLIKAGMDSRSVLARFEAERQALALMDHPNIAKVLDGGLTDSGRPFFVMEYVKGVPITEYCDATRLSVEERLNLFVQVCSALQHAHQKGIIHRDLKPSNILVAPYDNKPVPKVIDFGLAKALYQSLTDKTLYTAHEMVLGTPLYMSPEQAQLNNLDVDTRADIYSLGVLLYELLTGTTPIERKRFKEGAWDEIRRMIREEEPPRPSLRLSTTDTLPSLATFRHTEPAKLKKLVRGELDWIVMKALEKDRARRYETANGLARDIQRYLDDEVVEARPPSPGYRFGKFVRRHRGQVIAAGVVLLALLAGIAGTTWGLLREARANARLAKSLDREQKANADLAAANAKVQARYNLAVEAVKTFHTGVSEDFLLKEEKFKDLRNRLLKSASDFYGKLGALLGKETDAASRRALAESNFELAELTNKVGRPEAALTSHRAVLAVREALAAENEADAGLKLDVGRSLTAVAELLETTGNTSEALTTYRRSESLLQGLADSDPLASSALASCRSLIGQLLFRINRPDEALRAYRQARIEQEKLAKAREASSDAELELAITINRIAFLLLYYGQVKESEAEYRASLDIRRRLAELNPNSTKYRWGLAGGFGGLGGAQRYTDEPKDAETNLRRAMAIDEELAIENPSVTEFRSALSSNHYLLGWLLTDLGKLKEGEAELRTALRINQRLVEEYPAIPGFRDGLAMRRTFLGRLLGQTGRLSDAEAECCASVGILEELARDNPSNLVIANHFPVALLNLGDVARSLGRSDQARNLYDRTVALTEPTVVENSNDPEYLKKLVGALWRRGLTRRVLGDIAGAEADARRSIELSDRLPARTILYQVERASSHATLAGLAGRTGSGVSAVEGEAAASRAMDWLRGAVAVGYGNVSELRIEPAFDALRDRPDFKKLMAELEKNSPAQQEKK